MNRHLFATIACIILSVVFSVSVGFFSYFKGFLPTVSDVYAKALYYPEALYEEYQEEAERMIADQDFTTCKYPFEQTFYSEDGSITLILQVGKYNEGGVYANYITATVKNFGTKEQEVMFERSRKSVEEAYERAENYRNEMRILAAMFVIFLIVFTVYLIITSIQRCYCATLTSIFIVAALVFIVASGDFIANVIMWLLPA